MAIIVLKAWYLDSILSAAQVQHSTPDLRLSKTGLLKSGMRADFLDDVDQVRNSRWFERYLEGERVEFYLEGSGAYSISNLDLISREIYFNKRNTLTVTDPVILFCGQTEYPESSQHMASALSDCIERINQHHAPLVPLQLLQTMESQAGSGITLDAALIRKIKHCLVFVADVTPVASHAERVIPSPQVCVEVGYALQSKSPEHMLLVQLQRQGYKGQFPFEIEGGSYLIITDPQKLKDQLSNQLMQQLIQIGILKS